MKIFLSSLENAQCAGVVGKDGKKLPLAYYLKEQGVPLKWNLMSYYYIRGKKDLSCFIRDNSEEILIDSGAHSFQKGKTVDWVKYTQEYAQFIQEFDRDNVIGYFEMDVDKVIGYEKVLELRKILESVSDKIIPVWHDSRGIEEYKKMCRDYAGKVVAISGFRNMDIKDHQYIMFLKYAKQYGCKVHCLGMTRKRILDAVPFDYTDSSSWNQQSIFGSVAGRKGRKPTKEMSRYKREIILRENYEDGVRMQKYYYQKWRKACGD
jgi:hypothetical protein